MKTIRVSQASVQTSEDGSTDRSQAAHRGGMEMRADFDAEATFLYVSHHERSHRTISNQYLQNDRHIVRRQSSSLFESKFQIHYTSTTCPTSFRIE